MSTILALLQKHWTWILGAAGVILSTVIPAVRTWAGTIATAHPILSALVMGLLLLLAGISPSPLSTQAK